MMEKPLLGSDVTRGQSFLANLSRTFSDIIQIRVRFGDYGSKYQSPPLWLMICILVLFPTLDLLFNEGRGWQIENPADLSVSESIRRLEAVRPEPGTLYETFINMGLGVKRSFWDDVHREFFALELMERRKQGISSLSSALTKHLNVVEQFTFLDEDCNLRLTNLRCAWQCGPSLVCRKGCPDPVDLRSKTIETTISTCYDSCASHHSCQKRCSAPLRIFISNCSAIGNNASISHPTDPAGLKVRRFGFLEEKEKIFGAHAGGGPKVKGVADETLGDPKNDVNMSQDDKGAPSALALFLSKEV